MRLLPSIAALLSLLAVAAMARAEEVDWQASAKGLTQGPLCSLQLRVRIGKTLDLITSGGTEDTGWNTLGPADIPLGTIGLPTASAVVAVERSGDWSHGRAVASLEGGAKLILYASQLSPGVVVETSGDRVRLFSGQHERMLTLDGGKMKIHGHMGGNMAPKGVLTPAYIAVPQGDSVKAFATSGAVPAPSAPQAWALAWWGAKSHFVRTDAPTPGTGVHPDAYLADCPLLLVFDKPPTSIAAAEEGGLDLAFAAPGRRVLILPIEGAHHARAEKTRKWADAFPDEEAARCRGLASVARQYPLSVREGFRYDAARDEASFTEKVSFLEVGSGGKRLAPLPPMAAVALRQGLGLAPSGAAADLGIPTEFGPIAGAADADGVTWSVKGLAKYLGPPPAAAEGGKAPAALEADLQDQLRKMLEAGRLAPWTYADNIPIAASRGEYYFGEPGEVLYLLARLYPVLGKAQRAALLDYMADVRKAYPPETTALMPADKGARRGGYDVGPCEVSKTIAQERGKRVSLFSLYGLERYCALAGQKPTADEWQACRKVVAGAFEEQAWATLHLLGHPDRRVPWEGASAAEKEKLHREKQATDTWRGDRPAAVVNVNRLFAGAVGAVRLARLAGDGETEQQAWWLLARAAVLRHAMGKYAAWRYASGLAVMPPKPDWFWAYRGQGMANWIGDLETDRWAKPSDDVQQIIELAPDQVRLGHWAGVMGDVWTQITTAEPVTFRYLTPELASFLADHLKPECAAYAERMAWNQPTWYASFAEAILGAEHNLNHPSDAYEAFMARSMILGEKPEQLAKWIDVPWLERGDLFYMNKLAETIQAYRGPKRQAATP